MLSLKNRKVAVLGPGFIGQHITQELIKEGADILLLGRGKKPSSLDGNKNLKFMVCDVRDFKSLKKALEGIDFIIYTVAWGYNYCRENIDECFEVNIKGFFNFLKVVEETKPRKIIFSSSSLVYGKPGSFSIGEKHALNGVNFYTLSKIFSEFALKTFGERYGLNWDVLRYSNVYGPGQKEEGKDLSVVTKYFSNARVGKAITIHGDGSQKKDFVYVTDVARANILALKSSLSNEIYNVGTGAGTSLKDLATKISIICGAKSAFIFEPGVGNNDSTVLNISKARVGLNYKPLVSLDEGLGRVFESYNKK